MAQKKIAQEERAKLEQAKQEADASARLGAGAKGYAQRKRAQKEKEEQSKSAVMIQAKFRGKKERTDPAAEANLRRARSKNDPQVQAQAYMKTHKLMVRRHRRENRGDVWRRLCACSLAQAVHPFCSGGAPFVWLQQPSCSPLATTRPTEDDPCPRGDAAHPRRRTHPPPHTLAAAASTPQPAPRTHSRRSCLRCWGSGWYGSSRRTHARR